MLDLFIFMQVSPKEINTLIICVTIVFLTAPLSLVLYVIYYNRRKRAYEQEKELMKLTFETELAKTQLEVQEQTLQTIGADLHDNIGQLLSLTSMTLNSIDLTEYERASQKIADAVSLTSRSIKEMRLLGKLFQGEQLVSLGMDKAIAYEVDWLKRNGQLTVIYQFEGFRPVEPVTQKELILFRIMQEVVSNCLKHAAATQMRIDFAYHADHLSLKIADNGVGFDSDSKDISVGMGLHNIRKRAAIVKGDLTIRSVPGEGTSVLISIPYN